MRGMDNGAKQTNEQEIKGLLVLRSYILIGPSHHNTFLDIIWAQVNH